MSTRSFQISGRTVSLRIGSIYDTKCDVCVVTPEVLASAASRFRRTVRKRHALGEWYYEFRPMGDGPPLGDELKEAILADPGVYLRSAFEPLALGNLVVVCASSILLDPSWLVLDNASLIVLNRQVLTDVARDGVASTVTRILGLCDLHRVSSVSLLPFGQDHLSEPEKGIIDAVVAWRAARPRLIEIVSVDRADESTMFASVEDAITSAVEATGTREPP